jgi:hypothetical protein
MDVRGKLVELIGSTEYGNGFLVGNNFQKGFIEKIASHLIANGVTVQECAKPLEEWGEDYGDVLWWKFPIEEPPYVGSPLDANWPAYHTHWTTIPMPQPPKGE